MAEPIIAKHCSTCKHEKPVSEFHRNRSRHDGLASDCKACCAAGAARRYYASSQPRDVARERYREAIMNPEGAAAMAWHRLNGRVRSHPAYANVEVRVTRDEFLAWAVPAYAAFFRDHPGVKPSVDRERNDGHYEIGNLKLIPHRENCAKHSGVVNAGLPDGHKRCGHCKEVRPFAEFRKVKPGSKGTFGLSGWCVYCYREHDRQRRLRGTHK